MQTFVTTRHTHTNKIVERMRICEKMRVFKTVNGRCGMKNFNHWIDRGGFGFRL